MRVRVIHGKMRCLLHHLAWKSSCACLIPCLSDEEAEMQRDRSDTGQRLGLCCSVSPQWLSGKETWRRWAPFPQWLSQSVLHFTDVPILGPGGRAVKGRAPVPSLWSVSSWRGDRYYSEINTPLQMETTDRKVSAGLAGGPGCPPEEEGKQQGTIPNCH